MKLTYTVVDLYVFTFISKKEYSFFFFFFFFKGILLMQDIVLHPLANVLFTVCIDLEIKIFDSFLKQVDKHIKNRVLIKEEQKTDNYFYNGG